jgi:alkanesulfonate monooxygenase SsuD/methylene tetrahydromethanopterin reductase-like flavin-dependent oxidoreductase (luciferase family)
VREIVTLADGWNRWGGTRERFAAEAELVREVAPAATITWGGLVLTGENDPAAEAKAETRTIPEDALIGGPARLAEQLDEFVQRGADWVILGPMDPTNADNAATLGEVRRLLNA